MTDFEKAYKYFRAGYFAMPDPDGIASEEDCKLRFEATQYIIESLDIEVDEDLLRIVSAAYFYENHSTHRSLVSVTKAIQAYINSGKFIGEKP